MRITPSICFSVYRNNASLQRTKLTHTNRRSHTFISKVSYTNTSQLPSKRYGEVEISRVMNMNIESVKFKGLSFLYVILMPVWWGNSGEQRDTCKAFLYWLSVFEKNILKPKLRIYTYTYSTITTHASPTAVVGMCVRKGPVFCGH